MINLDSSLLLNYYQSRSALGAATLSTANTAKTATGATKYAPTAPWDSTSTAPKMADLLKKVTGGQSFINEGANQLDLPGASDDYRKLFALYQGLNALSAVASQAGGKNVNTAELGRLQTLFGKGLSEVGTYAEGLSLDQLRLTRGDVLDSQKATVGVPKAATGYTTQTLYTGSGSDEVPAFKGDAKFTLEVTKAKVATTLNIDLSEMGSTPRTMGNVVNYLNSKLDAGGYRTSFAVSRTAAQPRTLEVGGKTVTLPAIGDAFALQIKGDSTETLKFTPVTSTSAAYVVTKGGDPDPDDDTTTDDAVYESKLMKVDGADGAKVFGETLPASVQTVRKSVTAADGSVYMLADVDGPINGQTLKPGTDVALLKYDSAGNLQYTRTLGGSGDVTGLSLAINSDGKVAIAGAIKGDLTGATNGALNSTDASGATDSFATLYDAAGDEVWTVRRGALANDEAQAVAFDASGDVLVAGRAKSALPGATGGLKGGWDSYLTSYSTTPVNAASKLANTGGTPKVNFTQQFGTAGTDGVSGLVVDGSTAYLAGNENGRGVVRSFNLSGTTATAGVTRDLGDLQGGAVIGLAVENGQLYVGGNTRNAALAVGGAGATGGGGMDAFAASFSTDLSDTSADHLAYFGGAGNDTATAMGVADGKVWLAGVSGDAPTTPGGKDGYLAQLDMSDGTLVTSQKLSGKDGFATPTALAVSSSGTSVLDKFGLPSGTIDYSRSQKIVSNTAVRPGDTIQIRASDGKALKTVTIEANDTLDTLASKISRAAGFRAKVEVVSDGTNHKLKISPASASATVEVLAGKGGKDALTALGLSEGVVRATKVEDGKVVPADGKAKIYGLKLANDINLSDADSIKAASAELATALSAVRTIYRDLQNAAKPQTAAAANNPGKTGGPVPTYLKNQIANYTAALNRLNGS